MSPSLDIRQMQETDKPLVYSSWLRSFREVSTSIPKEIYFKNQTKLIDKIFECSTVWVACNSEDSEQLFGYVVHQLAPGDISVVHYIYVKHPYRRFGIGSSLMKPFIGNDLPNIITHNGRSLPEVVDKWNLVYDPYFLLRL